MSLRTSAQVGLLAIGLASLGACAHGPKRNPDVAPLQHVDPPPGSPQVEAAPAPPAVAGFAQR